MNYHELGLDEVIQDGDEWSCGLSWFQERFHIGETPRKVAKYCGFNDIDEISYRRPLPDSCPPTQRNTGTCERCRRMEEQLASARRLIETINVYSQDGGDHRSWLALRNSTSIWLRDNPESRARPEIEGNDGK